MKRLLPIFILAVLSNGLSAQFLTQSADGKGTFLFKGSNVAFDISKTDLSLTINNLNKPVVIKGPSQNRGFIYGATINAKNEDGIGSLISAGDFTPSAGINAFAGIQFSNAYLGNYEVQVALLQKQLEGLIKKQDNLFKQKIGSFITTTINNGPLKGTPEGATVAKAWKKDLRESAPATFTNNVDGYPENGNASITAAKAAVVAEAKRIIGKFQEEQDEINEQLDALNSESDKTSFRKFSLFAFQGLDASSFKRVDTINRSSFSKSFIAEEFRGSKTGLGANFQVNRFRFGVTYAYKITNNFSDLKKADYKTTTVTNSIAGTPQTLTKETVTSAYAGDYATVEVMELNADVIYTASLGSESEAYALINPYYRGNLYSRNQKLLPSSFSVGLGIYAFTIKSKFLGGFYVELPDVDNSIEKNKKIEEQNIRPAAQKLTFGIVAKFSLSSIISQQ